MFSLRPSACLLGSLLALTACGDGGSPLNPDGVAGGGNVSGNGNASGNGNGGGVGGSSAGASSTAGTNSTAGQASGGQTPSGGQPATGGQGSAGQSTGGVAGAGQAGAGQAGSSSGGGSSGASKVFSECRFHFGTIDSKAKEHPELIPELDFFTSGWMGLADTFDQKYVCDEAKDGAVLGKQVPVIVAYVSAFYAKRHHGNLCDCNVTTCGQTNGRPNDLCNFGAQYIKENLSKIVDVYKNYAQGYASCFGTKKPIVFEMEPDWYQYLDSNQTSPMTKTEAASIIKQYVLAMKASLPNAFFSIDISPWAGENGKDHGKDWYSNFDLSLFTFGNTSGGGTNAATQKIRDDNLMTWAGVNGVLGKPVLADTGYGANGASAGHDANWDVASNINSRIDDGVISISQYNPKGDWAATIKSIRSQLKKPKYCQ